MMKIGKLYRCSKHYLMIYPTAVACSAEKGVAATSRLSLVTATIWAEIWSEQLNCKVRFSEPNEIFMCLEQENSFVHVLFSEKQGWIRNESRLEIERIK